MACSLHLKGSQELLEKSDRVGGVARSFQRKGYTFDCTGHWLHLRDAGIERLVRDLLGPELVEVERIAEIHSHGTRTPYPFQANTHGLPTQVVADCVLGYFAARERSARGEFPAAKSFEDFIRQRMGDGIAEHFMIPYNTKLWTVPPRDLSHEWTGRFVPVPTPEEVVHGALSPAGAGRALGYNSSFLYPREGGIGRLADGLRSRLEAPVHTGIEVESISAGKRRLRGNDGIDRCFTNLVSTMPLPDLIARCEDAPDGVREAAEKLRATSVTYWDVGVTRANEPGDPHWIYFPDPELPFYRAGSGSAAVPSLAPRGARSYYVETSHPRGVPCATSDEEIKAGMRRVGLLRQDEVPEVFERCTIDCAYVIMDRHYGDARNAALSWLASQGIESIGRYGSWIYDSMEGAMVQGREAAARINARR